MLMLLPKTFKSSGLAFGSSIHSALEWLHKERLKGNQVSFEKAAKILEASWYAQKADAEIEYKNGESWELLLLKGKEIFQTFI